MPALTAMHTRDPRIDIFKRVGDLKWFNLRVNQILCAVYVRPDETAGGIILPDKVVDEDRYQGKVGLVLKLGPMAFVSDDNTKFAADDKVKVGDWVVYRASDGWQLTLASQYSRDNQLCRIFVESDIRAVITAPDQVW
jgi:co-chaperonin GroES (HSP10)